MQIEVNITLCCNKVVHIYIYICTIASRINVIYPQGVYLPISNLLSIFALANLLAHNNINQICCCGQISSHSAAVNFSFSDNLTTLEVTFILLVIERLYIIIYVLSLLKFSFVFLSSYQLVSSICFVMSLQKVFWKLFSWI